MPPKKKYSKEQIIDAAFEIARTEGIQHVTIRKVAEKLESSIAPIYVNFNDVDELLQEVINKTHAVSKKILDDISTGNPFQDIGRSGLRFAKEYPVLFRDIVMTQNDYKNNYDQGMGRFLIEQMKKDPDLAGFTDEELKRILLKMRIFQTGLTVMVANGWFAEQDSDERLMDLLNSTAADVVHGTRLHKQ